MVCGKTIFPSKDIASQAIKGFHNDNRPTKVNNKPTEVYFCTDCNGYHINSKYKKRFGSRNKSKDVNSKLNQKTENHNKKYHGILIIRNYTSKKL